MDFERVAVFTIFVRPFFDAQTSFDVGLARTVAWYRENEAWWRGILQRETQASVSSS